MKGAWGTARGALALALAACGGTDETALNGSVSSSASVDSDALTFHVVPAEQREADGDVRVFPQDFGPIPRLSVGTERNFDLASPVRLSGTIVGEEVTPLAASGGLPTQLVAVAGHVDIADTSGTVIYSTATDPLTGAFEMQLQPGVWDLRVVPDEATLAPTSVGVKAFASVRRDFTLTPEQAIYGQVLAADAPRAGALVFAIDLEGCASGVATTDAEGRYQLRVPAGTWEVTSTGVPLAQDPIIHADPVLVTADLGAEVDLTFPTTNRVFVSVRVVAADGSSVEGLPVRFTARSLDSYGYATFEYEALVAPDGTALAPLLPGTYDIEIAPPDGTLAGWSAEEVVIQEGEGTLDTVTLQPLQVITGVAIDAGGAAVGETRITCDEIGYAGRSWSTFSDAAGLWLLAVAPDVSCAASPPGGRGELAIVRETLAVTAETSWNPRLPTGIRLNGEVTLEGVPEAFAIVEALDPDGWIVGIALTDADGIYSLTLPPE